MPDQAPATPQPAAAFDSGWLDVGHGHRVYYEQAGAADGIPVVLLHGGPGSGSSPRQRVFYDPTVFRVVQFDQRGCGRSEPMGETAHNHTAALVGDIERLREHLAIERWLVSGGSWGSTLALVYAAQHRERVTGVALRAIFLAGRTDIEWYFDGSRAVAPVAYERFIAEIPRRWRRRIPQYLERSLRGGDADKCERLATAWMNYEAVLSGPDTSLPQAVPPPPGGAVALCAKYKVQAHYLARRCFLGRAAALRAAAALRGVPVAMIHGTRDLICLPQGAWRAHRACEGSRLAWAPGAGHNPFHPVMDALFREALACFAEHADFSRWPAADASDT
ncbi:MAG TPA: alpha/beta fold hydrolase [Rudaea sp.]|nr:alpha/beta fold hydrolase [Rudaea sp.]